MGFLKRHYEKIILSLVLVGLAAAAAMLTIKVGQEKKKLSKTVSDARPSTATVSLPGVTNYIKTLIAVTNPPPVDLGNPHYLFNPVLWKRAQGGVKIPNKDGNDLGVGALQIAKLTPLKFIISFTKMTGSADRPRYQFSFDQQDGVDKRGRRMRPRSKFGALDAEFGEWPFGSTNVTYFLKAVNGADPLAPDSFVLGMKDAEDKELESTVTVAPNAPYEEVRDYIADLTYPPTGAAFANVTRGGEIDVEGEIYNIVAISDKQVVLSAARNQKRTVIPMDSAPTAEP